MFPNTALFFERSICLKWKAEESDGVKKIPCRFFIYGDRQLYTCFDFPAPISPDMM